MSLFDMLSKCNPDDTDFKQFQELVFNIMKQQGTYLSDATYQDMTPKELTHFFGLCRGLWEEIRTYKVNTIKLAKTRARTVNKYSLEGTFMASYPSTKEAGLVNGLHPENISDVCRGMNNTSGGYQWSYAEKEEL